MGYVGLPLALTIASSGFVTYGVDVDEKRIALLKEGKNPLTDLAEIDHGSLSALISQGKFVPSIAGGASSEADVKMINVPTPLYGDRRPNLSFISDVCKTIGDSLKPGNLVINESTVMPGATRKVMVPILESSSGLSAGADFSVAASPERVDPGNPSHAVNKIPKVVGGIDEESARLAVQLYSNFVPKAVQVSSLEVAEATKMLENSYRALNIGFINEFARYCDKAGIDVLEVIEAASSKPFAFQKHYPGIGVGGTCIPKDPRFLIAAGKSSGSSFRTLAAAQASNEAMPRYVVATLRREMTKRRIPLRKTTVAIFGISYKGNVRDVRDSPALVLHQLLKRERVNVKVNDPHFTSEELSSMGLKPFDADEKCGVIVIGADHDEFRSLDYSNFKGLKLIIDGKNMLGRSSVPVVGIGRSFG